MLLALPVACVALEPAFVLPASNKTSPGCSYTDIVGYLNVFVAVARTVNDQLPVIGAENTANARTPFVADT